MEFRIHGLDCADEVAVLRRRLDKVPGIRTLVFDVIHAKMTAELEEDKVSADDVTRAVADTGLRAEPWTRSLEPPFWQRQSRAMLAWLSGLSLLAATVLQAVHSGDLLRTFMAHQHTKDAHHLEWSVVTLCIVSMLSGAWYVLPKAWRSMRSLRPDMNLLVAISLLGATYLGEWLEGATLSFLFALAALLESYSVAKARNAVGSLLKLTPPDATVVHGNHEHKVPVNVLRLGSLVRVRPGERIPCDGAVSTGNSDVNQALITGESAPVAKSPGDTVYAGTMNGDGVLEIQVTRAAEDTTIARIARMVENCQQRRAPSERFVEKFARIYTPAMILLAFAVAVFPPLLTGGNWGDWFYQSMVILLISCPCALVISTPVTIVAALASAARQGVLVKGGAFLEEAARLRVIAFDKTGVLTEGQPEVQELVPLNGWAKKDILRRLASLEFRSEHPLARAVVRYARAHDVAAGDAANFQVLQGKGAEAEIDGERFWAGNLRLLREKKLATPEVREIIERLGGTDGTVVVCGTEREALALVKLSDPIRRETAAVLRRLAREGIVKSVMLTGDNADTANTVARAIGVG